MGLPYAPGPPGSGRVRRAQPRLDDGRDAVGDAGAGDAPAEEPGPAEARGPCRRMGSMLSRVRLARYRAMTPSQRWEETVALMALAWDSLRRLPFEERQRRLEIAGAVRRRGGARPRRGR
jgi:hypothetical protein